VFGRLFVALMVLVALVGCSGESRLDANEREFVGEWALVAVIDGDGAERAVASEERRVVRFTENRTTDFPGQEARWYYSDDGKLAIMTGDVKLSTSFRVDAHVEDGRLLVGKGDSTDVFVRR